MAEKKNNNDKLQQKSDILNLELPNYQVSPVWTLKKVSSKVVRDGTFQNQSTLQQI